MKLKKDKEYLIVYKDKDNSIVNARARIVLSKTIDLNKQESIYENSEHKNIAAETSDINNYIEIIEPINNIELFQMWMHWNNFVNIDVEYAKKIAEKIKQSLIKRSVVKYGTGKLEEYDYNKLSIILKSIL